MARFRRRRGRYGRRRSYARGYTSRRKFGSRRRGGKPLYVNVTRGGIRL